MNQIVGYGRIAFSPGEPEGVPFLIGRPMPEPKALPKNEALAIALYAEWWKKRYPSARRYPFEEMRVTCPRESEAWLAVADMAILNLCS